MGIFGTEKTGGGRTAAETAALLRQARTGEITGRGPHSRRRRAAETQASRYSLCLPVREATAKLPLGSRYMPDFDVDTSSPEIILATMEWLFNVFPTLPDSHLLETVSLPLDGLALGNIDAVHGDSGKGDREACSLHQLADLYRTRLLLEGSARPPMGVRESGSAGAGHGVVTSNTVINHHQIPSGMEDPDVLGWITSGLVFSAPRFSEEFKRFRELNTASLEGRLRISRGCPLTLAAHEVFGRALEAARISTFTSTGRGFGEVKRDQLGFDLDFSDRLLRWIPRPGRRLPVLTIADLLDLNAAESKLSFLLKERREQAVLLSKISGQPIDLDAFDPRSVLAKMRDWKSALGPFLLSANVRSDAEFARRLLNARYPLVIEDAQGLAISREGGLEHLASKGDYGMDQIERVLGFKRDEVHIQLLLRLVLTMHGGTACPTAILDPSAEKLVDKVDNDEYATFAMRAGWLELPMILDAIEKVGADAKEKKRLSLGIGCTDRLDTFPQIKFCVGYRFNGSKSDIERLLRQSGKDRARRTGKPADENYYTDILNREGTAQEITLGGSRITYLWRYIPSNLLRSNENFEPLYVTVTGWQTDTTGARTFADLPPNARRLYLALEKFLGVPISALSNGPNRECFINPHKEE